jgi:BioD-like phosphotransacetylase family protein
MPNLYVTSGETYSGKSALAIGLGVRLQKDGLKVGYMKPVNINCPLCDGIANDEDVMFAKKIFNMPEAPDLIGPVALTQARLEQQLRGPEIDYEPQLMEAYRQVSQGRDVLVLEGGRSLREGYVAGLSPAKVVELLDAGVVVTLKYDDALMVDRALTAESYFGEHMGGLVINQVPKTQMDFVKDTVAPYLTRHGIKLLGVLPKEKLLAAPSVSELVEGLNAEVLCCADATSSLVEHMLVGAMSVESALVYFRRKPNKVVITGGDRADIQMAALETSTKALVLTGNLYPNPVVLNKAEELEVPVLLTSLDTLSAVETIEGYFGRSRFQQPEKMERFTAMLEEHLDFGALYQMLKLPQPG